MYSLQKYVFLILCSLLFKARITHINPQVAMNKIYSLETGCVWRIRLILPLTEILFYSKRKSDTLQCAGPWINKYKEYRACDFFLITEPHYLILEYVMYGKLLAYLRDHRTRQYFYNFSEDSAALTSRDLTVFGYCVARGMEYLASKKVWNLFFMFICSR